jgi:pimeloyl-ACP methyl ester carboxylesterase
VVRPTSSGSDIDGDTEHVFDARAISPQFKGFSVATSPTRTLLGVLAEPSSHSFDAHGIRLVVHEWGGDGPPVLLAHPTGFHGRVWAPVARRLAEHGRCVYSFDFRGHGDSDAPDVGDESYSWNGFADDARNVARHLGVAGDPELLACGHSKGGAALFLGEIDQPDTYARIWAYEPIVLPATSAQGPNSNGLAEAARRRRNAWPSLAAAYEAYASKPPLDVLDPEALHAYVDYGLRDRGDGVFELKCRPDVEAQTFAMGAGNGVYDRLGAVRTPSRVVCGGASTDITPEFGERIAGRLPNGSFEVMDGCGHFGPLEDPARVTASILAFAVRPA